MTEQNIEVVRRSYEAFNSRDLSSITDVMHPDFEVDLSNSMGFDRGNYIGERGLERFFRSYWDAFDSITIDLEEVHGSGDAIVVVIRARGRGIGSGAEVDARGPHLWRFRDGRVAALALFEHLDDALKAARIVETSEVETAGREATTSE